ncbi:MAG: dienelactone hydrolase family protein [Burkholderiales bacterium]|nr:dienelactone hydrolase family protein [Burkholderiales bacterium]
MPQQSIEYSINSTKFIGELVYNGELNNTRSTIILYPAMDGRGEFCLDYAKNLANNNFVVFVADVYGEGKSTHNFALARSWLMPLLENRNLVRERAIGAYTTVSQLTWINPNKIGAIGFCLGGMCMLEVARNGTHLVAGVAVHGVLDKSDLITRPISTKLMILNGFKDPSSPPEKTEQFIQELTTANNHDWVFINFGNTKHAFSDPLTGTFDPKMEQEFGREYNELAASRSFRYAVDFFKETLD